MKTKKDYDNAQNLLNSDKLFNAANSLFHRKKEALALNKLADAAKIIEEGHFVCEMLTLKAYYQTDHWKEVSGLTLACMPKCTLCSRPSECAHHNKYHGVKFKEVPISSTYFDNHKSNFLSIKDSIKLINYLYKVRK